MTGSRAWIHARRLLGRMKRGIAPETVWYKCIICDDKFSSLTDIHFGRHQLYKHVTGHHRVEVRMYEETCNSLDWFDEKVTERFKQILMNIHRDDYDDQLSKIRRSSIMERTGIQTARRI
jgi:hypothetical protein